MKKIILFLACSFSLQCAWSQEHKTFFDKGLEKAKAGEMEEALKFLTLSIQFNNDYTPAWYYRGVVKQALRTDEEAIADFTAAIRLDSSFKYAYLQRGISKKKLTDYEGALADYDVAIAMDAAWADAFYMRGDLYQLLSRPKEACADFAKAVQLGDKDAEKKVADCKNPPSEKIYPILRLTQTADSEKYGFDPSQPIKVGRGPNGGPANQRAYLDLLRDPQGKPIQYNRSGSCCDYKSDNGFMGYARLDIYEIEYTDADGNPQRKKVYISFYDYEEPMILFGFGTVKR
jgi:tetratricopeptide (TPR) repeat protein